MKMAKKTSIFFKTANEIFRHTEQLTKKALITKVSIRLLVLELKSDSIVKSKSIKFIVKKLLPDYK